MGGTPTHSNFFFCIFASFKRYTKNKTERSIDANFNPPTLQELLANFIPRFVDVKLPI